MYDEQTIRAWAYDPDRDSIDEEDQDEDLTLGHVSSSILLPLIDDPTCPKGDYLLSCLDYHYMFLVLRGQEQHLADVRQAADFVRQNCSKPNLQEWAKLLDRRLIYRAGVGSVDRQQALKMGHDLPNGVSRNGEIAISAETPSGWTVQFSGPTSHGYREWLQISKSSGEFIFSRSTDPKK